jgi:hypothetical protein
MHARDGVSRTLLAVAEVMPASVTVAWGPLISEPAPRIVDRGHFDFEGILRRVALQLQNAARFG